MRVRASRFFLPGAVLVPAGLVELWVRVGRVPAFVFPAPSAVFAELVSTPGLFSGHAVTTLGEVSQTVPVIATAPLLVLWFGYGAPARMFLCALIASFTMAVTAGAFQQDTRKVQRLLEIGRAP